MSAIRKQGINNTILSYIGIIVGFINLLVLQPFMLKPEDIGLTRILFSTSVIIGIIFPMGINGTTIKYFPLFRNAQNKHHGYFGILIITTITSYAILGIIIYLLKDIIMNAYKNSPLFGEYFNYLFPISFSLGFISILSAYSMCLFKTNVPTFLNEVFIRMLFTLLLLLYFLKIIDFIWFMRLYMLSFLLQLSTLFLYLLKLNEISFKIDLTFLKKKSLHGILKFTLISAIGSIASLALRNIDVTMLGSNLLKSNNPLDEIAIYAIGFTIGSIIETPSNALARIADPKISDAITKNDLKTIESIYLKSTRLLMVLGGLLFIGIYINIHSLFELLPEKYSSGKLIVFIISISAFINMATGINTSIISYSNRYILGTYLLLTSIIISIISNFILIPILGIEGAAIATGGTLLLANIFKTLLIYRTFQLQPFGSYVIVVLVLIAGCVFVNHFLPVAKNPIADIIFRSTIMTILYGGVIYRFGIANEATEFVKKLLNR